MIDLPDAPKLGKRLAIRVTKDALRQVRGGHPWIYDEAITSASDHGRAGDLAVIFDDRRKFAAIGLWDPASPIRIKVLHLGAPETIDQQFFGARLDQALALRSPLLDGDDTDACRLVHGENDGFPGLVVDEYADTLVVKLYSAAWWPHLRMVLEALVERRSPNRIVLRLGRLAAKGELGTLIEDGQVVMGDQPDGPVRFRENGLEFEADVQRGQKTGHFLDQRENRQRVREAASGRRVLDVFSHTGGFSLYAAAGGAVSVHSVDRSEPALASARRHMELNASNPGVAACEASQSAGDAFEVLADLASRRVGHELVVIDPPSFASRQSDVDGALHAYQRLTRAGLAVLAPGGLLVQASCSSRVTAESFVDSVLAGADEAGVELSSIDVTGHPLDHPVGFVHGHYLKAVYATRA